MSHKLMQRIKRVHFIGIGGVGMSGIAEVMQSLQFKVSGSDIKASKTVKRLQSLGVEIFIGHQEENVAQVDLVVVSSAIDYSNAEVKAAKAQRIPIIRRAEMLAELMRFKTGIAVAGTHGKTTTTSLIASILSLAKFDPTYVIGGKVNSAESNARLGQGEYLVAEADESDASFLHLQPIMAIVTNIDADHLATYNNDFAQLINAFIEFLHHIPFYGLAILCADDKNIQTIIDKVGKPISTYGIHSDADIKAKNIRFNQTKTRFEVVSHHFDSFEVTLNLPGEHNVLNALAAISLAINLDVDINIIQSALEQFSGIGRRFDYRGTYLSNNKKFSVIDDYGHHPKEVAATMAAAKSAWPDRRIVIVFQPHRYTRTADLFDDFCAVLSEADVLILTEVFAAGETPIANADGRALSKNIREYGKVRPIFIENYQSIVETLPGVINDNDVILTMGAGSIGQLPALIAETFKGVDDVSA